MRAGRSGAVVARVGAVVWLTVVWCAVMESRSLGTIVAGVLVAAALVLLFPSRPGGLDRTRLHPWPFVVMNATLFVDLVRANLEVAWAVVAPQRAGLRRGIVAVPLVESSDLVLSLLVNAVSLTPGSLILEVRHRPLVLYIHVLQLRTEADVHRQVLTTQRRMVAALGPRTVLPEIDAALAALATGAPRPGGTASTRDPAVGPPPEEQP
jgi:multicomponent Na+:H+ antiporter subunit E